jgi:putative ABC transport system substrate-binding protein
MRRREVLGLAAGLMALPVGARAQKGPARLGMLFAGSETSPFTRGQIGEIADSLRDVGLTEGRDYVIEARFAGGDYERMPALARELAATAPRMLFGNTIAGVRAVQAAAPELPVVMVAINDPVGAGLVQSLARPGGRTTGVATLIQDLTPKMLEYQRSVLPQAKKIGLIFNPANPSNLGMSSAMTRSAAGLGVAVQAAPVRLPADLDAALASLAAGGCDSLHLLADAANIDLGDRVGAYALERKIAFFSTLPQLADYGSIVAYGPPRRALLLRVGAYVKRLLDGADPATLPVEQPTMIELWISAKAAKQIGVELPPALLQLADRVVE